MRKSRPFAAYTSTEVMDLKKRALLPMLLCMVLLILDSRCAAQSARDALDLCIRTLIPSLFPMFVLSAMVVPQLSGIRLPWLGRLLGTPEGSEGLFLLGCAGGFPVGAACIVQAVGSGGLGREDARRMLGICSFCGPAFLFGILGPLFSIREAGLIFLIQLETAFLTALFFPASPGSAIRTNGMDPVSLPDGVKRAAGAMVSVCAWVTLAGVAAGFLRRWLAPLLPLTASVALTGLMELTNGIFAIGELPRELQFVLCAVFVCFGGVSVLLQIAGFAAGAGIGMGQCVAQKALQGLLGGILGAGVTAFGPWFLLCGIALPAAKIAVEISGRMVYNGPRKEGI